MVDDDDFAPIKIRPPALRSTNTAKTNAIKGRRQSIAKSAQSRRAVGALARNGHAGDTEICTSPDEPVVRFVHNPRPGAGSHYIVNKADVAPVPHASSDSSEVPYGGNGKRAHAGEQESGAKARRVVAPVKQTNLHSFFASNQRSPLPAPEILLPQYFCPCCQIPLPTEHELRSHAAACVERPAPSLGCPQGVQCRHTSLAHYWAFSHEALAVARSSLAQNNATILSAVPDGTIEADPDSTALDATSEVILQSCQAAGGPEVNNGMRMLAGEDGSTLLEEDDSQWAEVLRDDDQWDAESETTVTSSETPSRGGPDAALRMVSKQSSLLGFIKRIVTPVTGAVASLTALKTRPEQSGVASRPCPFYKKIPGTRISVDAFRYGKVSGCDAYLLSHFHSDHYGGLDASWEHGPIYGSQATLNLVALRLQVNSKYLHVLPMNEPRRVGGALVTCLDANHCPGSVLFLIDKDDGTRVLHTGDFRASRAMQSYPALVSCMVHSLYLDTTYCDEKYQFPGQQEVVDFCVKQAMVAVVKQPKTLVVVGTYSIGKERVFTAIAKALQCTVHVSASKKATLDAIGDLALSALLTTNPRATRLHVLPMNMLTQAKLASYLRNHADMCDVVQILGFRPTGWTYSSKTPVSAIKPSGSGNVHIYPVPYSEHSSCEELRDFVQWLRPQRILPTVNNGNAQSRAKMEALFSKWLTETS